MQVRSLVSSPHRCPTPKHTFWEGVAWRWGKYNHPIALWSQWLGCVCGARITLFTGPFKIFIACNAVPDKRLAGWGSENEVRVCIQLNSAFLFHL